MQINIGEINTALGAYSLNQNSTGGQNVGIGAYAGSSVTSGSNNVLIGYSAQLGSGGQSNQIVIGHTATGVGSNSVVLGNDSITTTVLKGNVGIGTSSPASKVDIRRTNATIQFDEFTTNSATGCLWFTSTKTTSTFSIAGEGTNTLINAPTGYVGFFQALAEKARFASGTGNFLINTTTDAGYKLDVNGSVRTGALKVGGQLDTAATGSGHVFARLNDNGTLIRIFNWSYGNSSGNTWVNGSEVASAVFALNSTTTGFLPPRMTQAQRNAIASPAIGLEIYQTDATEGKYIYKSSGWTYIG